MDADSSIPIIILFLLLLLHAFFAAAKEAIVSTRKARRLQLLDEGHPAAAMLNHLAEDASRLLATEQLALKFISFFIVALAVLVYALPLAQVLGLNNLLAVVIIIIITVLVTLVLGDLVPRELARSRAESMALWAVYPMHWLSHLAAPLARLVTRLSRV
jgi:putative hemolysin